MLNEQERSWIYGHAYLPEHLPDFVGPVSGAEPFICRNYLFFFAKKHLIFNGYPLEPESDPPDQVYDIVCKRMRPSTVALIGSAIWLPTEQYEQQATDSYYRLDLPLASIDAPVAYMLRRAQRELQVTRGSFGKEHKKIIKAFKRNMAPKGSGGNFLSTPNIFQINYMEGSNEHPFLNKFKLCALTNMSVNYTGDGVHATYVDGTPISMQMDLSFSELTPIYNEDYNEIEKFEKGHLGVGY